MADEKFKNEILSDEQLDNVAGGTYGETFADMDYFSRYCGVAFGGDDSKKREQLRDLLWRNGVKIKDHGGGHANEYFLLNPDGSKGQQVSRDYALQFAGGNINWKRANGLPF